MSLSNIQITHQVKSKMTKFVRLAAPDFKKVTNSTKYGLLLHFIQWRGTRVNLVASEKWQGEKGKEKPVKSGF